MMSLRRHYLEDARISVSVIVQLQDVDNMGFGKYVTHQKTLIPTGVLTQIQTLRTSNHIVGQVIMLPGALT